MAERSGLGSRIKVDVGDVTRLKNELAGAAREAVKLATALKGMSGGVGGASGQVAGARASLGGDGGSYSPSSAFLGDSRAGGGGAGGGASYSRTGSFGAANPYSPAMPGVGNQGASFLPQVNLSGLTPPAPRPPSYLQSVSHAEQKFADYHGLQPLTRMQAGIMGGAEDLASMGLQAGAAHLANSIDRSYLSSRGVMGGGQAATFGNQQQYSQRLSSGLGSSSLGYADTTQAGGVIQGSFGSINTPGGAGALKSAGFLGGIDPASGAAVAAQRVGALFTSQNYYTARRMGVDLSTAHGPDAKKAYDQIISVIERRTGHPLSAAEIQTGYQQGTRLYSDLNMYGDDVRLPLLQYWSQKNTGKGDPSKSGRNNNTGSTAQKMGAASDAAGTKVDQGFIPGSNAGMKARTAEITALGDAAGTPIGRALTEATGGLTVFNKELGLVTKTLEGMLGMPILRALAGKMGGAGAIASAEGALTARAAAGGATGRLAGLGSKVLGRAPGLLKGGLVAGAASLIGGGITHIGSHDGHNNLAAQMAGNAVQGAGLGFMVGGPMGAAIGGGLGAGYGLLKNKGWLPWGGSNTPAKDGGNGQTYMQIEGLEKNGGPPALVTSTIRGGHASNSYHYKGQAVDFAGPGGGVDTPELLAINKFFAQKYGSKLKELIYAGPGGTNIKDGKIVSGAFYGAATMAEHHNHVHVAATPDSLAGAGGGVSGKGGASPAATAGGTASKSSNGPSALIGAGHGGMSGDVFGSTNSGDILMAALAQRSGGGMAGGPAGESMGGATGKAAGGASQTSAASGPAPTTTPTGSLATWISQALSALHKDGSFAPGLAALIAHESGGNPNAVNNWDSNAKAGHPSKGIMQMVDGTFKEYALAGHGNIFNPVDNIISGFRYAETNYGDGMIKSGGRHDSKGNYIGYARGNWELVRDEVAKLHRGEMVLPKETAETLRAAVSSGGKSHGGGASNSVKLMANVQFNVQRGSEQEMRTAAKKFGGYIAEELDMLTAASR